MSKILHIGQRLKEERERLAMNQEDFGKLGGVGRKTQFNYENGDRSPDAAYLFELFKHGVDIGYVLTGIKATSNNIHKYKDEIKVNHAEAHEPSVGYLINSKEQDLISLFNAASPEVQEAVLTILKIRSN